MPFTRCRRNVALWLSARPAWAVAVILVTAVAAIVGTVSFDGSPSTTAGGSPARVSAPLVAQAAARAGDAAVGIDAAANAPYVAPVNGLDATPAADPLPPRTRARIVSMDAPIQHGLTAHQEQALSARLLRAHHDVATAPQSRYWTPTEGRSAVARAESWLGFPYSWAGGDAAGPTAGRCEPGSGADLDCHVVGFDCSGLMMYAWGAYASLPHLAATQQYAGAFRPTLKQLLPGDLVFFSGYLPGGTGHVAIYAGHGTVIEAPQSGSVIRRSALADVLAESGAYRGAVRPLTGQTPTLTAPHAALPLAGGTVTLHGAHLANVDEVRLGGVTVRHFAQHSDSAIVFHAPAHRAGPVAVTVSTSWQALSRSVALTYARPRPAPRTVASTPAPAKLTTPTTASSPASTTQHRPPAGGTPSSSPTPSKTATPPTTTRATTTATPPATTTTSPPATITTPPATSTITSTPPSAATTAPQAASAGSDATG